ncbi:MAG: tetratricopeptide repeat protein [Nitrospirae bacterium]|nr:tetratricopeptide repeat protein [Nitrospirota bacterium]
MKKLFALIAVSVVTLFLSTSLPAQEELFDTKAAEEHFKKGLELYFQKEYSVAAKEFKEAANINPNSAKSYYFLGYSYYKLGMLKDAGEAFEQGYQLDPYYSPIPPAAPAEGVKTQ